MWARLTENRVVELTDVNPEGRFHSDLVWAECPDEAKIGWRLNGSTFAAPSGPSLEELKVEKALQIDNRIQSILEIGAPSGDLHVALDDSSRADMGSLATTALAASSGAVPWPDSYREGWISIENTRIPLETPGEGLMLAAAVGDYYARVRQHGRSLKDAIALASKKADLDGIDIETGWPA